MGCGKGGLPLRVLSGREVTSDTLLLSDAASTIPFRICFELGTGTGEVLRNLKGSEGFRVGIDVSFQALSLFDRRFGQPVLCSVEEVGSTFRECCADLVLANPPYHVKGRGRDSPDELRDQARAGTPLTIHRFIFAGACLLRKGGTMVMTFREEQYAGISTGFKAAGFTSLQVIRGRGVQAVRAQMQL